MKSTCAECSAPIPESSRQGYCPRCLLLLGEQTTLPLEGSGASKEELREALPRTIGDYELVEKLGEGGMGMVFKAYQKTLGRAVALKMLKAGSLASELERRRFKAEAQAVARLKHHHIVAVHEIGEFEGRLFFSMDYIAGQTLAQIVGRTPLSPEKAARYTRIVAEAVQYAHDQGVLHRDLKPGNVLVDEKDEPHITDFGLAKEIAGGIDLTSSGLILGTPSYMPPEQADGKRERITKLSDVYSLGAILYDLLTGRPPFRADSPAETLRQVIERDPAPVTLLNAKVPRDLETLCLKCLAKDPRRRYLSAQDLADDLNRFLRGDPIKARRPGTVERAVRFARRHPTITALGLALLVIGLRLSHLARVAGQETVDTLELAPRLAELLSLRFDQIGEAVTYVSQKPELLSIVCDNQEVPPEHQLKAATNPILSTLASLVTNRTTEAQFGNWLVMGINGQVLANLTEKQTALQLGPRDWREYFQHAKRLTNGYYISRPYKSESDQTYKVAVIAPMLYQGRFVGAVGRMVGYSEFGEGGPTKMTVIGLLDNASETNRTITKAYAILWHPDLASTNCFPVAAGSDLAKTLDKVMAGTTNATVYDFRDPLTPPRWYDMRWVARLDPVPHTHLVVVYQVRGLMRHEVQITLAVLLIPFAVGVSAWGVQQRRRTRAAASAE